MENIQLKVAIIGTGNIGGAIARGLTKGSVVEKSSIMCADRSPELLAKLKASQTDIHCTENNKEAVQDADIVIIAVKPWVVKSVIEEIRTTLDYDRQIVVSIAAGVTFEQLLSYLDKPSDFDRTTPALFRVIPNTAIEALSSMTFVSACNASEEQTDLILRIFGEMGNVFLVEERLMMAGTALASSGIAFALRYIRAAIEGGVELGFYPHEAQEIVVHTVRGAVELLLTNHSNPEQEIDRVTTPGGITIRGLNEMELSGFTSSVIRGLKASQ
ncbi:MAG: pyrroline-5-carboxylate reductase [Tannerellaceae bacterium]|jgi:pyrroline-5-carboxylate reductase|nr:pyrroline-5-carboxylate reductase [Tannerellaceae bacterium]